MKEFSTKFVEQEIIPTIINHGNTFEEYFPLSKGESTVKYHGIFNRKSAILRVHDSEYYPSSYEREAEALPLLADLGISPKLYSSFYLNELDVGITIVEYIPGFPMDVNNQTHLKQLVELLIRLWAVDVSTLKYDSSHNLLLSHLLRSKSPLLERYDQYRDYLDYLSDVMPNVRHSEVISHADLLPENIIVEDKLGLIDWEFAGVGIKEFDLAYLIEVGRLPPQSAKFLLDKLKSYYHEYSLCVMRTLSVMLEIEWLYSKRPINFNSRLTIAHKQLEKIPRDC